MLSTSVFGGLTLFALCEYKKSTYLLLINEATTLIDLHISLQRRWSDIDSTRDWIKFRVPFERIYSTLKDNADVFNMFQLYQRLKLSMIHMKVEDDHGSLAESTGEEEDYFELNIQRNSIDAWSNCIRGNGQTFEDANDFRNVLKNFCIAIRRDFKYKKNDSQKIIVVCKDETCEWRIYASLHKSDRSFGIRRCNLKHTCGEATVMSRDHPRADSPWIGNIVKEKVRDEASYRPTTIVKDILRDYGVEVPYQKAYRGKEAAIREVYGLENDTFDQLRWYCSAVRETNPGSVAEYDLYPHDNKFRRLFICFHACLVGFVRGCRPLVFVDGTHIKTKFKGVLVTAVAKDANDDLFTIAYGVVSVENDENWNWFFAKLRSLFDQYPSIARELTFFSDRHPSIIKAVSYVFPGTRHAYCLRHLVDNFKKEVMRHYPKHNKKHWCSVFKKAAYATKTSEFFKHINEIQQSMPLSQQFIVDSEPNCWANSLFCGKRWGVINNNQAECWNSWVKEARKLPVKGMVDNIRVKIMTQMYERRDKGMTLSDDLCPKQEKKLVKNIDCSRTLKVSKSSIVTFEVTDCHDSFSVDIQQRSCSCKEWDVYGIPCKHAVACICSMRLSIYDYCDPYFRSQKYRDAYMAVINPIPTHDMKAQPTNSEYIRDPDVRVLPGRRKMRRYPSQVDKRSNKCKICGKYGHNRRTCKEPVST